MEKLNAAVIGFGHLGNFHAQKYIALENEGVNLVALVDPRASELEAKARKLGKSVKLFSSIEELFQAVDKQEIPKIDLASVSTSTDQHVTSGLELMKRGVHILVEKPLAANSKKAEELVKDARQKELFLAVGQVERFRALEVLRELRGTPYFIECHRLSPFPARSTDIDVIFDLMIHDIDLMLAMVSSPLKEVRASGFPVLTNQIDIANCRFEFENGCVANLTASRISMARTRKFRVFCGDSYLSLDLAMGTYEWYLKNSAEKDLEKMISHSSGVLQVEDALQEEIRDFCNGVRGRKSPLVSGEDGLRAIEVAEKVVADIKKRLSSMSVPNVSLSV
ncbi:MAG: Gfo/Idh/MocA family oxidoreductase [Oligoflexia bacterium]|nr:Gfo/Idh/MocA family oxidoreductase [Oligoflexia bacterium]